MPGTELKRLLISLRIRSKRDCNCQDIMDWMDHIGVAGCKKDRALLIERIRKSAERYGVWDDLLAAVSFAAQGFQFPLNPLDPIPGLFDEAVRRAEVARHG